MWEWERGGSSIGVSKSAVREKDGQVQRLRLLYLVAGLVRCCRGTRSPVSCNSTSSPQHAKGNATLGQSPLSLQGPRVPGQTAWSWPSNDLHHQFEALYAVCRTKQPARAQGCDFPNLAPKTLNESPLDPNWPGLYQEKGLGARWSSSMTDAGCVDWTNDRLGLAGVRHCISNLPSHICESHPAGAHTPNPISIAYSTGCLSLRLSPLASNSCPRQSCRDDLLQHRRCTGQEHTCATVQT